jgi:hypothetical protein
VAKDAWVAPGGEPVRSEVWGIFARSTDNRVVHCRGSASRFGVMPALRGQPPSKIPQGGPILPGRYGAGASRLPLPGGEPVRSGFEVYLRDPRIPGLFIVGAVLRVCA